MKYTFINLSNHKSSNWAETQLEAARIYGDIIDIPFPAIDPRVDESQIDTLTDEYLERVLEYHPAAVMLQGEFTFCFSLINKLKQKGITVVAACSDRVTREVVLEDGTTSKTAVFEFVGFREYI